LSILVVGSVALDRVETPFGVADGVLGGAASYFSITAALFGNVQMVAVVGTDFPQEYIELFQQRRIDLKGLQVVAGKTFRWAGRYYHDMNTRDTLDTQLNVFADFHPRLPDSYRSADLVFLANILPTLQLEVARQVPRARLRVMDTMNLWIGETRSELEMTMRHVDIVLMTEEEVRQFAGVPGLRPAVRAIHRLGPQWVVVKQGPYGALLFGADGSFFAAPAYPLEEVRDPTGAGDAFAGGFMGYLSQVSADRMDAAAFKRALVYGNIMGSFVCEDFSVNRLLQVTPEAIATRYAEFLTFTHFDPDWRP
jgi:sugar/nucleoside kinase (ribokinase family)